MANKDRRSYYGAVHGRIFGRFAKGIDREVTKLFVGMNRLLLDSLLEGTGLQTETGHTRYLFVVETERFLDDGSELLRPLCIWMLPEYHFVQKVNDFLAESYNLDEIKQDELLKSLNPPPDWTNWDYGKAI